MCLGGSPYPVVLLCSWDGIARDFHEWLVDLYFFVCFLDLPLPYAYLNIMALLIISLLDVARPCAWGEVTSDRQRKLWNNIMWFARVMSLVNMGLFLCETRKISRAKDRQIAQRDQEITQLKYDLAMEAECRLVEVKQERQKRPFVATPEDKPRRGGRLGR